MVEVSGVDVGTVFIFFARGVVGDVARLIVEVFNIPDAMFVISGIPNCSFGMLMCSKGIAAFDELNTPGGGVIDGWCYQDMNVIGHDNESVESEAVLVAILEERLDEEFGIGCALKVSKPLEG